MSIQQFRTRVTGRDLGSEDTVDLYCSWIDRFFQWFDGDEITEGVLRDFDSALHEGDVPWDWSGEYAYSTRVQAVSAVKKWAEVMEDTEIRPDVDSLIRGDPQQFDPTILGDDDVQALLNTPCDHPGCLAARNVGYDAIMRGAEVMAMTPGDVNPGDGTIYVRGKKGSANRTLSVDDRTMSLLVEQRDRVQRWFQRPTKLFYTKSGSKGMSADAWSSHFRRRHHDAGFHAFARHTSVVNHIREVGFGQTYLRARHQNPAMTARYASVVDMDVPDWV